MTTRKIPPNLVTTPATGIVSEAPKAIEIPAHLQNQISFHQQVAKRFRLVPTFLYRPPTPLRSSKNCGPLLRRRISTTRSQHSLKSGFLSSSRVSVRPATALCATADFSSAMEPQRATLRLTRKRLSRWSSF